MKKIVYLLMIAVTGTFFTSCNPMDDIFADIDGQENAVVGEIQFTLSDEDYDDLGLTYGNFNSVDDAKSMIPGLLTDKYPVWGNGSLANVTFKWYSPRNSYDGAVYELTEQEHNDVTGNTYGNFDRDYYITDYLEDKYPTPSEGDFHSLRYQYYEGGEKTLTDGFAYEDGEWVKFTGFTEDEYNDMGEGFPNFSNDDEAEAKIPIFLVDKFKYETVEAGDIFATMYELYVGGGVTESYTINFVFDGSAWSKYNNEANETIQFGHDGTTWVPDNTIRYSLTGADISLIESSLGATYPGPTSNVSQYGSFDRRPGGSNYWDNDMLLEAFNVVLDNLDPSAAEDQKYVLTIVTYVGATVEEEFSVIKTGGEWVYN